jgi:hypothetical protein
VYFGKQLVHLDLLGSHVERDLLQGQEPFPSAVVAFVQRVLQLAGEVLERGRELLELDLQLS